MFQILVVSKLIILDTKTFTNPQIRILVTDETTLHQELTAYCIIIFQKHWGVWGGGDSGAPLKTSVKAPLSPACIIWKNTVIPQPQQESEKF